MSWSPDLFVGEFRPWPDSVCVTRGSRIDSRIYVPKEALIAKELRNCHVTAENEKLRELVRDVMPIVCDGCHERLCEMPKEEHPFVTCSFADRMRELGVDE